MNEACVQYIVSKVFGKESRTVESYGIKAKTYSPNKYPLLCNILSQMLLISDEEKLVESTIYSNDDFIIDQMEELGEANYANIRNNLDEMLYASEEIINSKAKIKLLRQEDPEELKKIQEKEELICRTYMDCQMSIFTVYFNRLFKRINNTLDVKFYRARLNSFKNLLGYYTDESKEYLSDYYNEYFRNKAEELKEKEIEMKRKEAFALVTVSDNVIIQFFSRIKYTISRLLKREY